MDETLTPRVWFITGCSRGFGLALAQRVHARGEVVVATARSIQALRDIGRDDGSRVLRLELDVRDGTAATIAVQRVIDRFSRIDVLVNNAGYAYFGTQEEGELSEIRTMYETNVFGLMAMTQAVLPHMRARGSGMIVNMSGLGGRISTPGAGFYHSTMWAVEALSEAIHLETHRFGIRVAVIEPGSFDTDFASGSDRSAQAEDDPRSPYAELTGRWRTNASTRIFVPRQDPNDVIEGILTAVDSDLPFVRLPVGRDAQRVIARRVEMGEAAFLTWLRETVDA